MVFRKCLSARTANLTGLFHLSGTLQRHGENPRDKFFAGIAFSVNNIVMRYFLKLQRSLQMLAELCRRFLADEADFSEEKLSEAGIVKRFQNDDLERCLQEIFREITKLEGDE